MIVAFYSDLEKLSLDKNNLRNGVLAIVVQGTSVQRPGLAIRW